MTGLLIKLFIKGSDTPAALREKFGRLGSVVGIFVNILLASCKFLLGTLLGSISITADAVNNLSDAGSSLISLLSFRYSSRPADAEHPFGHARIEYAASFTVAFSILLLGVELLKSSFSKILHPDPISFSYITCLILLGSILLKLWLAGFYKSLGKKINSTVLLATAADSLSDVASTGGVLAALILSRLTNYQLDGYTGVIVAGLIIISGINILRSTLDEFMGQPPDKAFVDGIVGKMLSYDGVLGIHDLVVHSYGPGNTFASVHAEVSSAVDIMESHELIDDIERDFLKNEGINMLIHMDPIVTDDEFVNELREFVRGIVSDIDGELSMHDFRIVLGKGHSNLIFDIIVPYGFRFSEDEIKSRIEAQVKKLSPDYNTVITVDKSFVK